jgi:oligoribonuclease NrnB/cAMP/cGMP phosphodiesterase (DHH superfamily)
MSLIKKNDSVSKHIKLSPKDVNMVIYHRKCPDGFASILSIDLFNKYNANDEDKDLQYIPVNHNNYTVPDVTGKNVLICDFSFTYDETIDIIKKANNVLIIDHHETSSNKLANIPDHYKIFDMNHSAAVLTWQYVFPKIPVPLLLQYIEDRDTSRNKMEFTNEFFVWFSTIPQVFDMYEKYLDNKVLTKMIKNYGIVYHKLNSYYVNGSAEHAKASFACFQIGDQTKYYFIGYHNQTNFKSDVGNTIMTKYKNLDFAATYSLSDNVPKTKFALRSNNASVDVSKIAELFNGGGHRNAAGLVFPYITNKLEKDTLTNKLEKDTLTNKFEKNTLPIVIKTISSNPNLYSNLSNIQIAQLNKYNVAYLNTFACYKELAVYLLSMKEGDTGLQQALYIYNNTNGTNYSFKIDFALTYYYDSSKNIRSHYASNIPKGECMTMRNQILDLIKKTHLH